jgi:hypothetical protein
MTSLLGTRSLRIVSMLVAIGFSGAASAGTYYSITGGGGQAAIGEGLPLPIQPNKTPGGQPFGTMTMFPPLLIPVNPDPAHALIKQTGSAPAQMKIPPGVFKRVPASPKAVGVRNNNPAVWQVRTKISFSGPALAPGTMTFKKNGWRTASAFSNKPFGTGPVIFYTNTGNRFGGPSQTRVGVLSPVGVWANVAGGVAPCANTMFGGTGTKAAKCWAVKLPAHPGTLAAAGGGVFTGGGMFSKGIKETTPGLPKTVPASVNISVAANGTVLMSSKKGSGFALTNMATSVGFPWTTGKVTISAPSAKGAPEVFKLTGKDSRTAMGAGTISLVAGAVSKRPVSGPNANRIWAKYTLPEPGPALGAAAALVVLGICHGLTRRRSD